MASNDIGHDQTCITKYKCLEIDRVQTDGLFATKDLMLLIELLVNTYLYPPQDNRYENVSGGEHGYVSADAMTYSAHEKLKTERQKYFTLRLQHNARIILLAKDTTKKEMSLMINQGNSKGAIWLKISPESTTKPSTQCL